MPADGYAKMMEALLAGIPVVLNCDYLRHRSQLSRRASFWCSPDRSTNSSASISAGSTTAARPASTSTGPTSTATQPCVQVNNPSPDNGPHIRTIEWKQMMDPEHAAADQGHGADARDHRVTPAIRAATSTRFRTTSTRRLYKSYAERAALVPGLLVCGRLGEYRYYDMDQAVARALVLAKRILDLPADGERPNALQLAAGEPA